MRYSMIFAMILATVTTQSFAQSDSMQVDGKKRDFIVYAPSSGLQENPPLVLALHPLGASNTQFRSLSKWDAIADKEKIVVVYPQGTSPVNIGWYEYDWMGHHQ
jgi:poly(3-hydroxybutyrate) depolymerase